MITNDLPYLPAPTPPNRPILTRFLVAGIAVLVVAVLGFLTAAFFVAQRVTSDHADVKITVDRALSNHEAGQHLADLLSDDVPVIQSNLQALITATRPPYDPASGSDAARRVSDLMRSGAGKISADEPLMGTDLGQKAYSVYTDCASAYSESSAALAVRDADALSSANDHTNACNASMAELTSMLTAAGWS